MREHEITECFLSLTKIIKELLQDIVWLFVFKVMPRIDCRLNKKIAKCVIFVTTSNPGHYCFYSRKRGVSK